MTDPYEILGVNKDDDNDAVKKAYRALVKKYHPDKYVNSPLSDTATERIKKINEAYENIIRQRGAVTGEHNAYTYTHQQRPNQTDARGGDNDRREVSFRTVRVLIAERRFDEAEKMLASLPHIAETDYLTGLIYLNRGWYDKAKEHIKNAAFAEPDNLEYKAAYNSLHDPVRGEYPKGERQSFWSDLWGCCTGL